MCPELEVELLRAVAGRRRAYRRDREARAASSVSGDGLLEAHKDAIEKAIYFRTADLLNLDVDLVFYDTTSVHFEVDQEDVGKEELVYGNDAAGRKAYRAPRKRGKSKNGRDDAPQIVVGLAVTRDGFPVRHWIFPGNTVDVTTVEQVKRELKGWQLSRCVFVGDAGMVSAKNLKSLSAGGGKYIVCMPSHPGGEVATKVVNRPGRYQKVAQNLQVKEVVVGDGERRRATSCASIRKKPSASVSTESRCSRSWKRSSRACARSRKNVIANACASYERAGAMDGTCG